MIFHFADNVNNVLGKWGQKCWGTTIRSTEHSVWNGKARLSKVVRWMRRPSTKACAHSRPVWESPFPTRGHHMLFRPTQLVVVSRSILVFLQTFLGKVLWLKTVRKPGVACFYQHFMLRFSFRSTRLQECAIRIEFQKESVSKVWITILFSISFVSLSVYLTGDLMKLNSIIKASRE